MHDLYPDFLEMDLRLDAIAKAINSGKPADALTLIRDGQNWLQALNDALREQGVEL